MPHPTGRAARREHTRQQLVVNMIDLSLQGDCVYREFSKLAAAGTPEHAIYLRWEELAQTYFAGLRQLREQAIATTWPER
jgi:hypothetical protein